MMTGKLALEERVKKIYQKLHTFEEKINECKYSSITGYFKGPKELFKPQLK